MRTTIPLLQNVKVASPCSASWEGMEQIEEDRVHFCSGCKKNVYNLSAMSQAEAEGLLRKHEGHLCVRYYQRKDGTILTQNCPVGLQAVRLQLVRRSMAAAALMVFSLAATALYERNTATTGDITGKIALPVVMGSPPSEPPVKAEVTPPVKAPEETSKQTEHPHVVMGFVAKPFPNLFPESKHHQKAETEAAPHKR